jgi:Holliday junction resolvase RusA-like endonuclease
LEVLHAEENDQVHHIKKAKEHFYQVSVHIYKNDCADIYKRIRLEFCIEKYLDLHINVQLLTKICSGTLKLNVETGRYQNIVRENRTC